MSPEKVFCPLCSGSDFEKVFEYTEPPPGEVRFDFTRGGVYYREIIRCFLCGHFLSNHAIDMTTFYRGQYMDGNYQDLEGIRASFERITALNPARSDNFGRVQRVQRFGTDHFSGRPGPWSLLDIGSGLGVFPYAMKKAGWLCTALDPDERAVLHARETVKVEAISGDFMTVNNLGTFDVITFNKVLEHVENPVKMLKKAKENLKADGFVYIELPDGEMAAWEGKDREEFFIDHLHVFSFASTALLAKRAGFTPVVIERLQEPSTKYTIRAFLSLAHIKNVE